jgi:hypothetical protein
MPCSQGTDLAREGRSLPELFFSAKSTTQFNEKARVGNQPEILLHAVSPFGNLEAIVEADGRTVYLYLDGGPHFGTRAVWVRNLVQGPLVFHQEDMQRGQAPVLPRIHAVHPGPGRLPTAEELSVVWFAEGNGVALFEREHMLAAIPPWSGLSGFHGYAAECAAENDVCWPLPQEPELRQRIEFSRQYWHHWGNGSPFRQWQPQLLASYEERFGASKAYFNINGDEFPPRGLGVFESPEQLTLATVGMSLCFQPMVEMASESSQLQRRVELLTRLSVDANEELVRAVAGRMSSLAGLPWREWTWLGDNHTCPWLPHMGLPYVGLFAVTTETPNLFCKLPEIEGDPVQCLGLVPMTERGFQELNTNRIRVADFAK